MLIATTERVAGHEVAETLGEVFGIAVRSRGVVGNLLAGLKTIVGGEIHQYTEMLQTARQHAVDRMVAEAQLKGADAVLMNTGIAGAQDPVLMAEAMKHAVIAGRQAYVSGRMQKKLYATASSPVEGVVR